MINVVHFSGGRTSGFMVWLFEQRRKAEGIDVKYIFCDTGAEHPKTYEFIREIVKRWKINLTCLRADVIMDKGVGVTYKVIGLGECKQDLIPFHDICKKYGTPNINVPLCSQRLKSIPAIKYCNDKYGKKNYLEWLGMRIDEPKRIKNTEDQLDMFQKRKKLPERLQRIRYLAEISDFTKEDVIDWWGDQNFDLEIDEHLGNCVFCYKKSTKKVALATKDEPEMAKKFIEMVNMDDIAMRPTQKDHPEIMYRGHHSLDSIIKTYNDTDSVKNKQNIYKSKSFDTGSCSESCEPAVITPDMLKEDKV